ncbi:Lysophospholipase L1 [Nocardia amikacinitolerans]|uniref:SGNH/GDSL hydrolase family protein n=1 Tax=Nocardia amikacinitolerans TaxID=756689 RepID=UPI000A037104|nr:SGNH/GDSL hydrolase family protein [Nocardia amikacinitolerans]MCP2317101.1 Lysophospholipase L1 [Nocardia amikacinitolerans]
MRILRALLALLLILLPFTAAGAAARPADPPGWTAAWATSPHQPSRAFVSNWALEGFANQTLRQEIRVSEGGLSTRVRLTNRYGATPLKIAGATIARTEGAGGIQPESLSHLTVGLSPAFVIAPGADLVTDPVALPLNAFDTISITLYFAEPTGPATQHAQSIATTYRAAGDHRADPTAAAFTATTPTWYYLAGVEVADLLPNPPAIVAFGDSITDGVGSTTDADNRFPDELAERLAAAGTPRAVLNQGIGGNRVTVDSDWLGESALHRFQRDVLDQPGVGTVIILEGANDIGLSAGAANLSEPPTPVSAEQLIAAHRELIGRARAAGLRVIGATILPFGGSPYDTPEGEAKRTAVNEWIRTSGEYDAVVDTAAVLADPANPSRLNPAFDSGDRLHPNDAGFRAMAQAVNLADLR